MLSNFPANAASPQTGTYTPDWFAGSQGQPPSAQNRCGKEIARMRAVNMNSLSAPDLKILLGGLQIRLDQVLPRARS